MEYAIADTCFLIDWALWKRRDVIFDLFKVVFTPELVLREVRSERTLEWITDMLTRGSLALFTETPDILDIARSLVERSRMIPGLRGVDLPEAVCLAAGKLRGYLVLTENRGALMAVDLLEELRDVKVWRALEVIAEALRRDIIKTSNPRVIFKEYEDETHHRFPRRDLEVILDELGR